MKRTNLLLLFVLMSVMTIVFVACGIEEIPSTQPKDKTVCGVVSADTGAIVGAEVAIRSTSIKATTDNDGKYSVTLTEKDAVSDIFTLVIKKEGYLEKTISVSKNDFVDDTAKINAILVSENITLVGSVTSGGEALAGVQVSVSCDTATTMTDEQGKYTLTFARPIEQFILYFSKEFYETVSMTVKDVDKTQLTADVDLTETSYSVGGVVSHYFYGNLQGVNVSVDGTNFNATTAADGSFEICNITSTALPYMLSFSKDGYQTVRLNVTEDNATVDVELTSNLIALGTLSPSNKNYTMSTVRDSKGFYFYFTSEQQFVDNDKICIYIDVNETGNVLNGSSVVEFALLGNNNANDAICLLWNLKKGSSVTESAEILWGEEVKYTLVNDDNGAKLTAFISYDTFAKAGEEFAVTKDSVVGITFFDRSADAKDACGWDRTDMPGVDGMAWVNPETPKDFVRLAPENVIYEADNNDYIAYGTYTINVTVADSEGNPVNAIVKVTYPVEQTLFAAENVYAYTLDGICFNKVARFEISAEGYVAKTVLADRNLFANGVCQLEVTLEKAPEILTETGSVIYYNGALQGATVTVKGYEGAVTTDENGNYDLSLLDIVLDGATKYTLVISKEGFKTKEAEVNVGGETQTIYMTNDARNLGKFGKYGWNVTIDRDETKLIVDLASDRNWYGYKDLEGNASTENELQLYFVTDLKQKTKTADGLRELTLVEKQSTGVGDWAGWRNGNREFLDYPAGILYTITNDESGCKVHVEVAYSLLNIDKTSTIGFALGEWYGAESYWSAPFYNGETQSFVDSGWGVNINDPSTTLHWAADNFTKVEYVA